MTSITNNVLLDSSFFVESYKGQNPDFYQKLTESTAFNCCFTETVCSEYWFQLFSIIGERAPLSLKESKKLSAIVDDNHESFSFYKGFTLVSSTSQMLDTSLRLLRNYNLLSNDSLILGACIAYKIPFLASYDSDFEGICDKEGITLITPENYLQILNQS